MSFAHIFGVCQGDVMSKLSRSCWWVVMFLSAASFAQNTKSISVRVERGIVLKFWTLQPLTSADAKVGDSVPLELARSLVVGGKTLLETGATAHGIVTKVSQPGSKCAPGEVRWKVDNVQFSDGSSAETEKLMEIQRADFEPPERYPSRAIRRGRHDAWKWIVFAPLLAVEFPILAIGMSGEGETCAGMGQPFILPAETTIVVAVSKDHKVRVQP